MGIELDESEAPFKAPVPFYKLLYVQVIIAIVIGVVLGYLYPHFAEQLRPLGLAFIRCIKMVVGPIVFLTVVTGISAIGDMRKVGRVGIKAIIYFEVVTTFALGIGLCVVNLLQPGAGLSTAGAAAKAGEVAKFTATAHEQDWVQFLLNIIPDNVVGAFAKGDLLEILFFSVLFGLALTALGEKGKPVELFLEQVSKAMFKVIDYVVRLAPLGALGAVSFTIGHYGIGAVVSLASLVAAVYLTMVIFIVVVLGFICWFYRINVFRFLGFIGEELSIVLGTSSSESVLPRIMEKLQRLGCSQHVVGLVIPTGYTFNLDGTSIYLSMAAIFIAQAYGIDLSIGQQLSILLILMLTSKGAAAVAGGGFVTLAATLTATNVLPVEGLALLLGVDAFMSLARALTNLIGNSIATVVVAKMEGEFDEARALDVYRKHFDNPALTRL